MYKIGHESYGIKIVSIIWSENIIYNNDIKRWKYVSAQYYVKLSKYKYRNIPEYELNSMIAERQYKCRQIIQFVKYLKIKLMLEKQL
jgi:hypothetical protein